MSFMDDMFERAAALGRAVFGDLREVSGNAASRELRQWFEKSFESQKLARGNPRALAPFATRNGTNQLNDLLRVEQDLAKRLSDYEDMDCYTTVMSALDIYADDATIQSSQTGHSIWAVSDDIAIKEILDHWLHNIIRADDELWERARGVAKYGNLYDELLIEDGVGVVGLNQLPVESIRRLETEKGALVGFVQNTSGRFTGLSRQLVNQLQNVGDISQEQLPDGLIAFEPWQMSHSRLRGKNLQSPYGYGIAENVRWVFRRLLMLQDALLIHKLTKSPARFAYFVEVGDMSPDDATSYLQSVKTEFRNERKAKAASQSFSVEYQPNPLAQDEDIWIPTRGGTGTSRVEVLSGADYQATDDVEMFERMLHAGLKVPKSYLASEADTNRATLSQQDVQFARSVLRLGKGMKSGLKHAARVHLAAQGIDPDRFDWTLETTMPSSVFELAQIEVEVAKSDLASRQDQFFPREWIMEKTLRLSSAEATALAKSKREELLQAAKDQADLQMFMMQAQVNAQGQLMAMDSEGGPPRPSAPRPSARPSIPSKYTQASAAAFESASPSAARETRRALQVLLEKADRAVRESGGRATRDLRESLANEIRKIAKKR